MSSVQEVKPTMITHTLQWPGTYNNGYRKDGLNRYISHCYTNDRKRERECYVKDEDQLTGRSFMVEWSTAGRRGKWSNQIQRNKQLCNILTHNRGRKGLLLSSLSLSPSLLSWTKTVLLILWWFLVWGCERVM